MPKLSVFPKGFLDDLIAKRMPLFLWLDLAGRLGVEGVEMYPHFFDSFEPRVINRVKRALVQLKLEMPMMCNSPDFTRPAASDRRAEVERTRELIGVTADLGGKWCRVLSGQNRPGLDPAEAMKWVIDSIRSLLPAAEAAGVTLVIENHYKDPLWEYPEFAQSRERYFAILEAIDSPWFKAQYDPSNATVAGEDPYEHLELALPRLATMQASDRSLEGGTFEDLKRLSADPMHGYAKIVKHGVIGKGMHDYDRILGTLARAGYDGWISIEDGEGPTVEAGFANLKESVKFLREKMAKHFGQNGSEKSQPPNPKTQQTPKSQNPTTTPTEATITIHLPPRPVSPPSTVNREPSTVNRTPSTGQLAGKIAVITGATQGVGAAVAERFASEGAAVVLGGLEWEKGEAVAEAIRRAGGKAAYRAGDLRKAEDCRGLVQAALDLHGGVDLVVNSAADNSRSTLDGFTPAQFDAQFHVNVLAPLLLAQAALPSLRERKGAIINIGSVNAGMGWPNLLLYAASKTALQAVSRNLANALKYDRVRVYCLNLGWTNTEGERAMMAKMGQPPDFLDEMGKKYPIGRLIKPSEIAEVCLFLASDKAVAFSGTVIELEQFPIGSLHDITLQRDPTVK